MRVLTASTDRDRVRTRIEYVVDAETFAPVSATSTSRIQGATASTTATFGGYERIPLTQDSAT